MAREIAEANPRRWLRLLLVGLGGLVLVLLAATVLLLRQESQFGSERRFDAAAWKSQLDEKPVRLAMVRDLMRRHNLVGKTRAEVIALLGPPLSGDHKFGDEDMVYWLGPENGFISIDSEWLIIDLGDDGRVVSASVVGD